MPVLNGEPGRIRSIKNTLLTAVPGHVLEKDPTLESDAKLLAESIAGGAEIFVTRDIDAVTHLGPAAFGRYSTVVIDPVELPTHIEQRADAASYLPAWCRS